MHIYTYALLLNFGLLRPLLIPFLCVLFDLLCPFCHLYNHTNHSVTRTPLSPFNPDLDLLPAPTTD